MLWDVGDLQTQADLKYIQLGSKNRQLVENLPTYMLHGVVEVDFVDTCKVSRILQYTGPPVFRGLPLGPFP